MNSDKKMVSFTPQTTVGVVGKLDEEFMLLLTRFH